VTIRKTSNRESLVIVELEEGRNREVRRLMSAVGHEVTRLRRVQIGGLSIGNLAPGEWRRLSAAELQRAFPGAPQFKER
jgi:23S rRNA pseudouridine2605 synthase